MQTEIFVAETKGDLENCFSLMKELRPHLTLESYLNIYEHAHKYDDYKIVAIRVSDQVLAVMGYRILWDLVRGKHIYIDDLISSENSRSKGLGAKLLKYAEQIAKQEFCETLRLCTGIDNERGIKFYEKNGWTRRAYAYSKKFKSE